MMVMAFALVATIVVFADFAVGLVHLPVPGAALGLLGLAGALLVRGRPYAGIDEIYDGLSPHFALFFVPAATGLIASGDTLENAWYHAIVAVVFGTGITIAVTGLVAQALFRKLAPADPA